MCLAAPAAAQTLTSWDYPVNVAASSGALAKSAGCDGCADAGAHSTTQLAGDGYAEFIAAGGQRLFAGLGSDLSAATSSSTINYAFSLWPSGAWEVRELGLYRTEGTYAAGDRFRVAVESGVVVYRRNGTIVYASTAAPAFPLVLDVTLYSLGASISQASVTAGAGAAVSGGAAPPAQPSAPTTPTAPGTVTSVGAYSAVIDRLVYPKPALPVLGAAGTAIDDPVFHTTIRRLTDAATRPGSLNRSYRTPSSPHQNEWSVRSSYFYVMGSGGVGPIPFAFDASTGTARRLLPAATGDGGMVLSFYIEPQFSYVADSIIYGSYNGPGSTLRTIDQYDFSAAVYTRLLDLDALVSGLAGTYIGGVSSSGGPTERILAFFGGTSQDRHHLAVAFDRADPRNRQIVDTLASTINGMPSPVTLNFSLHHAMIDRSGRYVMLYTTSADQAAPRYAAQEYLWDLQTGAITELGTSARPYGHDAFGYGVLVNKDCCTSTTWDAAQWQFRSLASPLATRDVIQSVLTPKEVYLSDHTTWNNAQPDRLVPVVSGLYRYGTTVSDWRPWDDEIVAIQTDAAVGAEATVWRFAHHRSNVAYDGDATRVAFWYQPHPNVSQDGNWILFTSNWEKTLGADSAGEVGAGARQDVFLLALKPSSLPVAIGTTSLPSGRATRVYTAAVAASGGSGVFAWSASGLPGGLLIDSITGAISGTPSLAGAFAVTIAAADAANTTNRAAASFTLVIAPPPVAIVTTGLASGRVAVPYAAALTASGGGGIFNWTLAGGALPAGLVLSSSGVVSGVPTAAGSYTFTASAADALDASNASTASYAIAVLPTSIGITTTTLPSGRERVAYAATVQASGGSGIYTWSAAGLPPGLTLSAAGSISGTPTVAGTYGVTLRAADKGNPANVATATFTVSIAPAIKIVSPRTLPPATARTPYAYTVLAANVVGTAKWNLQGGSLPPGLTLNSATGLISGTCTTPGSYSFNARVKDVNTNDTLTLTIVVN